MNWENLLMDKRFHDPSPLSDFDGRNPFENDYSRIISSSPIRRLQDKTQVFPLQQSDFIRTRLTHSLEVSSIAASIGKSVEQTLKKQNKLSDRYMGYLPSLLFTTGLVHDLGNPPYGHFGETAFQDFFKKFFHDFENCKLTQEEKADFENFDGNVQAFRILRKLSFLGHEYSYNLTYPTLATIIKYPCDATTGNKGKLADDIRFKKFGFFKTEQNDYEKISSTLGLNGNRHPATFLLEAADDIAYSAADIEDGVKLGCIDYETIREVFKEVVKNGGEEGTEIFNKLENLRKEADKMPGVGMGYLVSKFRIATQVFMIKHVIQHFVSKHDEILEGQYKNELLMDCPARHVRECFKELSKIVFKNPEVLQAEMAGYEVISGLLNKLVNASYSSNFKENGSGLEGRYYNMISRSLRYLYENHSSSASEEYRRLQLIVDFVSGMTDNYALNYYKRLTGISY